MKSEESDLLLVPPKVRLPENLFIVGTVNVDETTYMFSPKVLDRANVLEFRATSEEIGSFLDAPTKVNMDSLASKGEVFGREFVAEADSDVELESEIASVLSRLCIRLTFSPLFKHLFSSQNLPNASRTGPIFLSDPCNFGISF